LFIGALLFAALPHLYFARKHRARMTAIEEQFPDALDFIARSVRAGNALSISLEMLAGEASEPLRSEFLKVSREQALGASLDAALGNLVSRVPLVETRFFVSAVLLQREAGGNLAEVLSRLANSVRDRLRLRGHVRAVSGQGRLTAAILTVLPIVVVVLLKILSSRYLEGLTGDPRGRMLLGAAVLSQILGYLSMRKIVNIEVAYMKLWPSTPPPCSPPRLPRIRIFSRSSGSPSASDANFRPRPPTRLASSAR
jgi:tight adherence protein B